MESALNSLMPIVVLLLLMPHSSGAGDPQALINQICGETTDINFCKDVFNKHLQTPMPDVKELTQIALTQTLIYGSHTIIFIRKAEAAEKNKEIKNLYKICDSGYGILLDQFENAKLDFAKGDYGSVAFHVGKCDRFITDCQSVLGSKVPELSEQNSQNKVLVKMSLVSDQLIRK